MLMLDFSINTVTIRLLPSKSTILLVRFDSYLGGASSFSLGWQEPQKVVKKKQPKQEVQDYDNYEPQKYNKNDDYYAKNEGNNFVPQENPVVKVKFLDFIVRELGTERTRVVTFLEAKMSRNLLLRFFFL